MAYRTTTLNDVFQSVGNSVATLNKVVDPLLEKAAQAELQNQQIDMNNWLQDQYRAMENSTDYDNFEENFRKAWDEKTSNYKYKSLYSKANGDKYLKSLESQAMNNVKDLVQKGQNNYIAALNQDSLDKLAQQPVSQDRVNQQLSIINDDYKNNRISASQYFNQSRSIVQQAQTEEAVNYYKTIAASHPYATDSELDNMFNKFASTIEGKLYDEEGNVLTDSMGNEINHEANKQDVINQAKKTYTAQLNSQREANDSKIKDQNTSIMNDYQLGRVDVNQAILNCENQILKIEKLPNTTLDVDQKRQRTTELYTYLTKLQSVQGSGSKAASNSMDMNSLLKDLKALKVSLMYDGQHGDGTTMYGQKEAFETACREKFYSAVLQSGDYYATSGRNANEDYALYIQPLIDNWIDDSIKGGYIPEGAGDLIKQSVKNVGSLTKQGYADFSEDYNNFIYDSLFAIDYNTAFNGDIKKISEYITNKENEYKDAITGKKLDALLNPQSKSYNNKSIFDLDEKDLLTYVSAQDKSIVYSYGDSTTDNIKIAGKTAQALAGKGSDTMQRALYHAFAGMDNVDLNNMNIDIAYQPTEDGFDVEGTFNFTISGTGNKDIDGYTFRFVTDDKGKNVILEKKKVNLTWKQAEDTKQIYTVERKKYEQSEKDLKTKEKEKVKETQAQAKSNYNSIATPGKMDYTDLAKPEGMSDEDWKKIKNNPELYKKYFNDWLNKNNQQTKETTNNKSYNKVNQIGS